MKLFDALLLIVVRYRLRRFQLHDSGAQQFFDGLVQAIAGELARRSALAGNFDPKAFEVSVARMQTRIEAATQFEQLEVGNTIHFQ